ncbi:MAG TPA: protein arginine kinase [Bacillota bacterium]|nr:protein arginine kinase [Bacillota bacterium]
MPLKDIITRTYSAWMSTEAPHTDVALSSRVRLARNLGNIPFPNQATETDLAKVVGQVVKAISRVPKLSGLEIIRLSEASALDRQVLVEKHLISPQHAQGGEMRLAIVAGDESISVMVNEEDHIRIQTLLPGFQLYEAYQLADEIDDLFESQLDYAFDERIGYLAACPTNVGTGLRVSIMVHLPALAATGHVMAVLSAVSKLGIAVRGLYGEGSEALGNMYQLSNQVTLGRSEHELIENLGAVTMQVIEQERAIRKKLMTEMREQLEDRVQRAYGILCHARLMTSQEALKLLSDAKLGAELNLIPGLSGETINELMVITQPAYLKTLAGQELDPADRDIRRATLIRERIRTGREGKEI